MTESDTFAFSPLEASALERALRVALAMRGLAVPVFGAVLPAVMATFGLSNAQASLLPAVGSLGSVAAALSSGSLSARLRLRTMALLLTGLLVAAALILAGAPTWAFFVAGAFLLNWGTGGLVTLSSVLLALAFRRRSGQAFNRAFLFIGVGSLASPLLVGGTLAFAGSWRWTFVVMGVAYATLIFIFWGAPYPPNEQTTTAATSGRRPWWRRRPLILCAAALACYVGAEASLTVWAARFLSAERGTSIASAASAVSLFWGGMIGGRYTFSRWVRAGREKAMVGLASSAGIIAVLIFLEAPGRIVPLVALGISGLAFGGVWPTVMSYAAMRATGATGAASSLLVTLGFLGGLLFPAWIGILSTWVGLGVALKWAVAVFALAAALFALA